MYKVQSLKRNVRIWTSHGNYGSEQGAIAAAQSILRRGYIDKVRVLSASGAVVWMGS